MKTSWKSPGASAALFILLLTVLAYRPALEGGFVWDDDSYVTENETLRSVTGLEQIWTRFKDTKQYYPMVFTSFWLECHLWKLAPFGYHLVNVLLHALNAILLWRVLRRLEVPGAWWAAAIFALHPVEVESVAWVTELKNVLSGTFYFLALLAYLRFRPLTGERAPTDKRDGRWYPLVIALFLFSLLSKTVTCSLPAVIALLVWWKRGRLEKRDVVELTPLFALGGGSAFVTVWIEKHYVGARGAEWALSFVGRCLVAGRALWFYVGKLFWPCKLTFIYPKWPIDTQAWWQYLFPMAAVAVLGALWLSRRRIGRGPLVAALCFAGTLVPALGFFSAYPFRYSFVADHFQYLAGIALITLTVSGGATICGRFGGRGRGVGVLVGAGVLAILGVLTSNQGRIYRDVEVLWRDTLAKNPACWMAYNNLGNVLFARNRTPEAIEQYEQALRVRPDFSDAYNNLGNALLQQGKVAEAIEQYRNALRITPGYAKVHNNLGNALVRQGKVAEAIEEYQESLRIQPAMPEVHYNLGLALAKLGRVGEAIAEYREALRLDPDLPPALGRLAWILATSENPRWRNGNEAVGLAERLCELTGDNRAEPLDVLAAAYAGAGRFADAAPVARAAAELAGAAGQSDLARHIQDRLRSYQAGQPWREAKPSTP
ncbi:MAG TPA: tetratricopeptide repeat protein [Verrucomicrobiae bacterium]|nr:tetratricopeptide repeat protein [Verrucomicrobiae bacterium]